MNIESQKKLNLDNVQSLRNMLYPTELTTLGNAYYDAIVTRCIDKKNPGWIRVSVLGITDSLPVLDQPWAEPAPGEGNIVPSPGSYVSVTFKNGDVHFPVWHSAGMQNNGKFLTKEALSDYPNNQVMYRYEDGTTISNNTKTGNLAIEHGPSGASVVLDKSGILTISNASGINPLVKQYGVVTGAVICPYKASLGLPDIFHPVGHPNLIIDDSIVG